MPTMIVTGAANGLGKSIAEHAARSGYQVGVLDLAPEPTREVAEAIGVTFLMQGGPATVYGPRAYDAFCEYYDAQHPSSGDAS